MSAARIALLGAVAGCTIFVGLPIGRLRAPMPRVRALLNALAIGILVFLLWDVLAHAWAPVETSLAGHAYLPALRDGVILAAGTGLGLLGLVYFDRWVARRAKRPLPVPPAAGTAAATGTAALTQTATATGATAATATATGAATVTRAAEGADTVAGAVATGWRNPATQLALLIAIGIGLHNFAEGLAIGNQAASGEMQLALMLIIGFGLHNGTEGFGIVAPMSAAGTRVSWGRLALLGLIGGGPTFLGTVLGQRFTNETLSVAFLALAAGSILYVVIELLAVGRKFNAKSVTTWGLLGGLLLGFATDAILIASGA